MPTTLGPIPEDEQEIAARFRELTKRSEEIKAEYADNAEERRTCAQFLRERGWSFRRIGDLVEISGQRVDSILKIGQKKNEQSQLKSA